MPVFTCCSPIPHNKRPSEVYELPLFFTVVAQSDPRWNQIFLLHDKKNRRQDFRMARIKLMLLKVLLKCGQILVAAAIFWVAIGHSVRITLWIFVRPLNFFVCDRPQFYQNIIGIWKAGVFFLYSQMILQFRVWLCRGPFLEIPEIVSGPKSKF